MPWVHSPWLKLGSTVDPGIQVDNVVVMPVEQPMFGGEGLREETSEACQEMCHGWWTRRVAGKCAVEVEVGSGDLMSWIHATRQICAIGARLR